MDTATHKDIAEIREELVEEGYLRNRQQKQAKTKTPRLHLNNTFQATARRF